MMAPELLLLFASKNVCYCCRTLLANAVPQTVSSRDPNLVTLEIHTKDVVVGRGGLDRDRLLQSPCRVRDKHFWFVSVEGRAVNRPIRAVVVGKSFVR